MKLTETQRRHVIRVCNVLLVKNRVRIVHLVQIVNANHVMQENSRQVLEIALACNAHKMHTQLLVRTPVYVMLDSRITVVTRVDLPIVNSADRANTKHLQECSSAKTVLPGNMLLQVH